MPGFGKSGIERICCFKSMIAPVAIPKVRLRHSGFSPSWEGSRRSTGLSENFWGMPPSATFVAAAEPDALVLRAEGDWLLATAAELDRRLRALDLPSGRQVMLDLAGIERLDTAGAWLLKRTDNELAARGNAVALANVRASLAPLLDQVWTHGAGTPLPHPV